MLKDISKYWTSSSDSYDKAVKAQFRSRRTVSMRTTPSTRSYAAMSSGRCPIRTGPMRNGTAS